MQYRVRVRLLDLDGVLPPARRLRQVGLGAVVGPEAEGAAGCRPRQRHAAAVAPLLLLAHAMGDRVLEAVLGDVGDLGQTELIALIQVHGPRQGHDDHGGGARPALAANRVAHGGGAVGADPAARHPLSDARGVGGVGIARRDVVGEVEAVTAGHARGVVAAEDPGGRAAGRLVRDPGVDGPADGAGGPVGILHLEIEGLPQARSVGGAAGGDDAGLRDGEARRAAGVEHGAPLTVDVVDLVAVEQGMGAVVGQRPPGDLRHRAVGLGQVLGHTGGGIDAEPVHTAVAPEAQDVQEVLAHGRVIPVEVGLLGGEDVEVPLPGPGRAGTGQGRAVRADVVDALPGGAAEHGAPVVGRFAPPGARAGADVVQSALGGVRATGQGGAEPLVAVGGVVGDDVHHHLDASGVEGGDHAVEVLQGADLGGDLAVVVDVVTAVGQGGGVEGGEPDGVDAEGRQVGDAAGDAGEVADAVAVGVGEGARVDLVDDGVLPPLSGGRSRGPGRRRDGLRVHGHGRILPGSGRDAERAGGGGDARAPGIGSVRTPRTRILRASTRRARRRRRARADSPDTDPAASPRSTASSTASTGHRIRSAAGRFRSRSRTRLLLRKLPTNPLKVLLDPGGHP